MSWKALISETRSPSSVRRSNPGARHRALRVLQVEAERGRGVGAVATSLKRSSAPSASTVARSFGSPPAPDPDEARRAPERDVQAGRRREVRPRRGGRWRESASELQTFEAFEKGIRERCERRWSRWICTRSARSGVPENSSKCVPRVGRIGSCIDRTAGARAWAAGALAPRPKRRLWSASEDARISRRAVARLTLRGAGAGRRPRVLRRGQRVEGFELEPELLQQEMAVP